MSAARRKVAPAVVGCDFTVVAKRLADVRIIAVPSKMDSDLPANTIVTQKPEAGAPLTDSFMAMRVSRGPAAVTTDAPPCSAVALRLAVDKKVFPAVVGCQYDSVRGPLAQLGFTLRPSRVNNDAPLGRIVRQTPAAGSPMQARDMDLQVSDGPAAPPPVETTPTPTTTPPAGTPKPGPTGTVTPVPVTETPKSGPPPLITPTTPVLQPPGPKATPMPPRDSDGPGFNDVIAILLSAIKAYPLPAAIAALMALLLAGVSMRSGKSRPKGGAAPRVRCELIPGPSRLVLSGPLVLGRKEGEQ